MRYKPREEIFNLHTLSASLTNNKAVDNKINNKMLTFIIRKKIKLWAN